jgi:hypothetical protein
MLPGFAVSRGFRRFAQFAGGLLLFAVICWMGSTRYHGLTA